MTALSLETQSRADFFVHPDYHRLMGGEVTEELQRYEAALHERIEDSRLPILIHDPHPDVKRGDFWDIFPTDQRFPTHFGSGTLQSDYYGPQAKLNGLLDERKVIEGIVHGSYLAQCVRAFREHLKASDSGVIYYYRSRAPEPASDIVSCENIPSSIKFGIVLGDTTRTTSDFDIPESDADLPPEYADDAQIFCIR